MMSRRTLATGIAAGAVTASMSQSSIAASAAQGTPASPEPAGTPTVVLVHGAFADAASWSGVILELQAAGIAVIAPPNPLRGLSSDAAYIASFVNQVPGPVVLVGHSYGGAVNTVASASAANVVGLVYVAAFIPEVGETLLGILEGFPPSLLPPALRPWAYPLGEGVEPGHELFIDAALYKEAFAADLPDEMVAWLAVTQRPGADIGFGEPAAAAGWKTIPSWAAVATADVTIGYEALTSMATRSGATITEIDASHSVAVSQPKAVAEVIMTAVTSVG
jgi:pimeloyl-ACP methyl ester carboxylesterase